MNRKQFISILAVTFCMMSLPMFAQSKDWEPTGVWPFINKQFKVATVYVGLFKKSKTQVPCNIHVGKQTLWYSQNDTLLEALPGTVLRVEFPNGDTYMPVGSEQKFGRIVREDTINGRIARVICVREVDRRALDQRGVDVLNNTQNILQSGAGLAGLGSFMAAVADANGGIKEEERPLPMNNAFYYQLNGEIFPATTKNILAHIDPTRKTEYKNYTRTAEIISTNESSMVKVWKDFFLK
ncbi:MAG: hypothetical protein KBT29_05350 [Prevotellaceae bacterium]|nr:hypothetical protein [Candidatus Minthosoma caballi]